MENQLFVVRYDFSKCQPPWKGDYVKLFGEHNEGIQTQAPDAQTAVLQVAKETSVNPFYLRAEPVK
jgi:hypothetical protein